MSISVDGLLPMMFVTNCTPEAVLSIVLQPFLLRIPKTTEPIVALFAQNEKMHEGSDRIC
jgi:hypothetical protein